MSDSPRNLHRLRIHPSPDGDYARPPVVSPTEIVSIIKSITANTVFSVIPSLKRRYFCGSALWSRGYYIGTAGNVSAETIKKYIEAQKSSRKEVKK